jgi:hypothetical protein
MMALALLATYSLYAKDKKKDKNAEEEQPKAAFKDNRQLWSLYGRIRPRLRESAI